MEAAGKMKNIIMILLISFSTFLFNSNEFNTDIKNSNQISTNTINSVKTINLEEKQINLVEDDEKNLAVKLIEAEDSNSIEAILKDYYEANSISIEYVYFAKKSGEFYSIPVTNLPPDYDPRSRIWYKETVKNKIYISEEYKNYINGKKIITVSTLVSKDNKDIGVIGIDKYVTD